MNFLCKRGHRVSAPFALSICPLASCQEPLHEVGPNWGTLKRSKAETAAHYEQQLADAKAAEA